MTIEQSWENAGYEQEQSPDNWSELSPIPVRVEHTDTERIAPEMGALTSWQIAVIGVSSAPTQLCPHRYHRYKAKFTWTLPANSIVYISTDQSKLMSNAFGMTYQIITGANAIVNSTVIMPEWDAQKPLYAIANVAGAQCSVMDEGYNVVQ